MQRASPLSLELELLTLLKGGRLRCIQRYKLSEQSCRFGQRAWKQMHDRSRGREEHAVLLQVLMKQLIGSLLWVQRLYS
jgi:hypothetical protein